MLNIETEKVCPFVSMSWRPLNQQQWQLIAPRGALPRGFFPRAPFSSPPSHQYPCGRCTNTNEFKDADFFSLRGFNSTTVRNSEWTNGFLMFTKPESQKILTNLTFSIRAYSEQSKHVGYFIENFNSDLNFQQTTL